MKRVLAILRNLRPAGLRATPDAAFLLQAGAMLSHEWLAPQVVLVNAQHPRRSGLGSERATP